MDMSRYVMKNLLELMKEHPDLEVIPIVNTDVVAGSEHEWWVGNFGKANLDEVYEQGSSVFLKTKDFHMMVHQVIDDEVLDMEPDLGYKEIFEYAARKVNAYDWKKVIVIHINPPE